MHQLIERYIYDVTRRLPEGERDEVSRELEANIADMLPENPGEQDIANVLTQLGAPAMLSEQYRQKPRCLISPALYDTYTAVMKTVLLIVGLVSGCVTALMEMLHASPAENIGTVIERMISNGIGSGLQGVFAAAFWVTFGFAIAEHKGINKTKAWTIHDLPELSNRPDVKLPRVRIIVNMALTVFFTVMVILIIVRYESMLIVVHGREVVHPFTQAALYRSIPYIIALGCLSLVVSSFKLYCKRWTTPLCLVNVLHNVIWVSVVIYILHWPNLWSDEFVAFMARTFTAKADILRYFNTGGTVLIISGALILAAVIDSAEGIKNTYLGRWKTPPRP